MKIVVLGGTGFVGRNILEIFSPHFDILGAARIPDSVSPLRFDLENKETWSKIVEVRPDIIINAAAYGVIKNENQIDTLYGVNYFLISEFFSFVNSNLPNVFWLQLGTAFEYDLNRTGGINEKTPCLPKTHYGISKLMMSNFLMEKSVSGKYSTLRPFGMFGKYEDESKFFPMLILTQKKKINTVLSAGTQLRDYFFVEDLGRWLLSIMLQNSLVKLPPIINVGSGRAISLRDFASELAKVIPDYDAKYWQWNKVEFRANESGEFYNSSSLASSLGFSSSDLSSAFLTTARYYYSL